MRVKIFHCFLILAFLNSCKKIETQAPQDSNAIKSSRAELPIKPGPTPDVTQPLYSKFDLQSQGNGTYAGLATDNSGGQHQVTVDGINYKTTDDYGNLLPVRDGDPIYGTLHVLYSDAGSSVVAQPDGNNLQNHFAVNYGVLGGSYGAVNIQGYFSSYNSAFATYL